MLESKILEGKTNREIAHDFGVSESTVYKALSLAKKAEIVVKFEDRLYQELLPLAHSAVLGALADGNAKIGLAVLQGTQVLRPNQQRTQVAQMEDDELARHINRKRAQAALEEHTIDGTIQPRPETPGLPSGPQSEHPGYLVLGSEPRGAVAQGTPENGTPGPQSVETGADSSSRES